MGSPKKKASTAYQVRISGNALANIDEITGYIAFINKQPLNAIEVGDTIYKTIDRIGLSPHAFNECHELHTTNRIYRRAVCLSWLMIYKVMVTEIVILGIIHKSRKPSEIKKMRRIK